MQTHSLHQLLKLEIETLPDTLIASVFDYVLFVKTLHKEEQFLWQQIEETHAYRQQHPEDVRTVTAEEWDQETAFLEAADELPNPI